MSLRCVRHTHNIRSSRFIRVGVRVVSQRARVRVFVLKLRNRLRTSTLTTIFRTGPEKSNKIKRIYYKNRRLSPRKVLIMHIF